MAHRRNLVATACFVMVGFFAFASGRNWVQFSSSKQFSVLYPEDWVRTGTFTDRLQILSSEGGAEGVVIKRGQAEITVMEAQGSAGKNLSHVIELYTKGTSVLLRRDIPQEPEGNGCRDLKEVTSKERAIPSTDSPIEVPYVINTDFFCAARGREIVILLRNWQGDKRQGKYQQIARRMAKSVRFSQ